MDGMDDGAAPASLAEGASEGPAVASRIADERDAWAGGRDAAVVPDAALTGRCERTRSDAACSNTAPSNASPAEATQRTSRPRPDLAPRRDRDGSARYAALDLGTNNCRLLIAEPRGQGYRVIDAFSRIVRLGEGVSLNGRLADAAMHRAMDALTVCARKLGQAGVQRSRLIATEACRMAENGGEFVARVEQETGLSLEIVSRETEARLAVAGCANLIDRGAEGVVLFDIGGGSSEIVWLDLSGRHRLNGVAVTRCIRAWTSLPVGVVSLAERHGGVEVDTSTFQAMVADVSGLLARLDRAGALDQVVRRGRVHLLGTSGTVTTLAGVHLGLDRYDRRRVDGTWLDERDVDQMIGRILAMPFDERVANPCIGADRADLVLAGCAILEAIRQRWPCRRLRVADRGLREGILMELMAEDRVRESSSKQQS